MHYDSNLSQTEHFSDLEKSYNEVGSKCFNLKDFEIEELQASLKLFEQESISANQPRPKSVSVYALLSGQPFNSQITNFLCDIQSEISSIIKDKVHYFVKPKNLGIEHCVFKWPDDPWQEEWDAKIKNEIKQIQIPEFRIHLRGIQFHPDGCIIIKGFDECQNLLKIRKLLKQKLPFLPEKQSSWAHVPLGRILEPIGHDRFSSLKRYVLQKNKLMDQSFVLNKIQYVHETRWYMEERREILSHRLKAGYN